MAITWTLKLNSGTAQTLAYWGIRNVQIAYKNLATDVMTFDVPMSFDGTAPFAFDDTITLYRDSTIHFKGRVAMSPRIASARSEYISYEIHGPWQYLEQLVLQQSWVIWDTINSADTDANKSKICFGLNDAGSFISTSVMLENVIDYAITYASAPLEIGDLPTGFNVPDWEATDVTCAEALRQILKWHPDAVSFFDYSTSPPTLNITSRADMSANTLTNSSGITQLSVQSRPDLQPTGVVLNFERLATVTEGTEDVTKEYITQQKYPTLVSETASRVIVMTVDFKGENGGLTDPPTGLAQNYYDLLSVLQYDVSLTLKNEDISTTRFMGKTLNITGYLSAWGSMNALVQTVSENIDTGTTSITCGIAPHLQVGDFIDLITLNRRRKTPDSQRYGNYSPNSTRQIPITGEETAIGPEWVETLITVNSDTGVTTKTILLKD